MAQVSRNPFAREELHRESVRFYWGETICRWCGGTRKGGKLWQYRIETDGGTIRRIDGVYCSVSCFRAYNGIDGASC